LPGLYSHLCALPALGGLWAYGPLPGVELFGYFLALLAWVGLAVAAVLRVPIAALFRWLRRRKETPPQSMSASGQGVESPVEGRR
jgi:hypothetical protein